MRLSLSLFGVTLALSLGREETPSPLDEDEETPSFYASPGEYLSPSSSPFPFGFTLPSTCDPWGEE